MSSPSAVHGPIATPPGARIPKSTLGELVRGLLAAGGLRRDMRSGLERQYRRHGAIVAQYGGRPRFLNLFGPDANRFVLLDPERVFSARIPWMRIMGRIFPNGLLLMDGAQHAHDRRLMHAPFTRAALRVYADRMNPLIEAELARWGAGGSLVRLYPRLKQLTLELAARIFLGSELGSGMAELNRSFEHMVAASMSRLRLPIPGLEFQRGLAGRAHLEQHITLLIESRDASEGDDLLSRMCRARDEQGAALDRRQILDHMIFLMMAAHDTTTSTLTSMAYELARHPGWQDRVRDESLALGSPHADLDGVERLPAATWVMREALRLYPPLPVIPRVTTAEVEWSGYRLPAGAMVVISPIHTHYMEEWWSDPHRFDPERFAPGRAEDARHSHSFIPFGGGPHLCLGRRFAEIQIRAILHQLVRRFRLRVPEGYTMPVQQAPISKPTDGLPLELRPL